MSGELSSHPLSFNLLISLSTIMQGWMHSLWDSWRNQAALELPQRSCSLVLLVMPFKCRQTVLIVLRIPSVSTPGCSSPSHHNFPVASTIQHTTWSNGLNTLSGAKELGIFWYGDKSQGLISLVVSYILNMGGGENRSWENGLTPMNADHCSSKPFTISMKGQLENSLLFCVMK